MHYTTGNIDLTNDLNSVVRIFCAVLHCPTATAIQYITGNMSWGIPMSLLQRVTLQRIYCFENMQVAIIFADQSDYTQRFCRENKGKEGENHASSKTIYAPMIHTAFPGKRREKVREPFVPDLAWKSQTSVYQTSANTISLSQRGQE